MKKIILLILLFTNSVVFCQKTNKSNELFRVAKNTVTVTDYYENGDFKYDNLRLYTLNKEYNYAVDIFTLYNGSPKMFLLFLDELISSLNKEENTTTTLHNDLRVSIMYKKQGLLLKEGKSAYMSLKNAEKIKKKFLKHLEEIK